MRRMLLAFAFVALLWPATAGAEEAPYFDIPSLLPPTAQGYQSTRELDCVDGRKTCIDDTIARMTRRFHRVIPICDHRAVFSVTYLRVTEDIREAEKINFFDDSRWLQHEDAVFARLYFDAFDNWAAGRRARVPEAWRMTFQAGDDGSVSALGDLLLNMNAHIQRDMPFVLAGIGLVNPDGRTTHKPDHDRYNERLAKLYGPVIDEIARRFDPTTDDNNLGSGDELLAVAILQSWREGVWRNAERLHAARSDAERRQVADSIEEYAALVASTITQLFGASPAQNAARDAHCAIHGGQDPDSTRKGGIAAPELSKQGLRRAADKTVPVKVSCPVAVPDCVGSVTLKASGVQLGRKSFAIEPEQSAKVRVPLGSRARAMLSGGRSLRARVELRRQGVPSARKLTRRAAKLR